MLFHEMERLTISGKVNYLWKMSDLIIVPTFFVMTDRLKLHCLLLIPSSSFLRSSSVCVQHLHNQLILLHFLSGLRLYDRHEGSCDFVPIGTVSAFGEIPDDTVIYGRRQLR